MVSCVGPVDRPRIQRFRCQTTGTVRSGSSKELALSGEAYCLERIGTKLYQDVAGSGESVIHGRTSRTAFYRR